MIRNLELVTPSVSGFTNDLKSIIQQNSIWIPKDGIKNFDLYKLMWYKKIPFTS